MQGISLLSLVLVSLLSVSTATTAAPSTHAPTKIPTAAPSSAAPTSKEPTGAPTRTPTEAPSLKTVSSHQPTASPTSAPTTSQPTVYVPPCQRNLSLTQIYTMMSANESSCPVLIRDYTGTMKVYDVINYGQYHPHGLGDFLQFCGQDMTAVFEAGPHSFIPFMGNTGTVGGINRSSVFICLGNFLNSTLAPTPTTPTPALPNASIYPCLSAGKEYQIRQSILDAFNAIPLSTHNTARAAFNGGLVRLAFHDAATYSQYSNSGGADGCVNLNDPDNAGLLNHTIAMEALWLPFKDRISRADFWFLAATTVIANAGGPQITFRYGRTDCTPDNMLKNNGLGRLPLANRGWSYVKGLFNYAMGLSDREITALMGAHVLGRAHPYNSGFDGPWVSGPSPGMLFSNQFYLGLQTVEWTKEKNNFTGFVDKYQWDQADVPPGSQMFLTSDIDLLISNADDPSCTSSLVDIDSVSIDKAVPKDPNCTKNNATLPIVREYSQYQANFYRDFAAVYQKVSELGYAEGSLLSPGTCFPGAETFANDPPVPMSVQGNNTIGGMAPGGFAVLLIVLVGMAVALLLGIRYLHKKRALEPLNQTEAELIKHTSAAARAKAGKAVKSTVPAKSKAPASAPTILIATVEPLVEPLEREPEPQEIPALPATLPKGVSSLAMTDEPVS